MSFTDQKLEDPLEKNDLHDNQYYQKKTSSELEKNKKKSPSLQKETTPLRKNIDTSSSSASSSSSLSTPKNQSVSSSDDEKIDENDNNIRRKNNRDLKQETPDLDFKLLPEPELKTNNFFSTLKIENNASVTPLFHSLQSNVSGFIHNFIIVVKSKIVNDSPGKNKFLLNRSNNAQNWSWDKLWIVFALIILAVLLNYFSANNTRSQSSNQQINQMSSTKNKFYQNFNSLKEKYPNQTTSFWSNIETSFGHSILESGGPSIILVVNEKSTSNLANKITNDLFNFFLSILKVSSSKIGKDDLVINPMQDDELSNLINSENYDAAKKYVDTRLDKIFLNGYKFALVQHIERLPATTMLLFYTYGDDVQNAKYPGIVILMSLELSDDVSIENSKREQILKSTSRLSELVESHLFHLYSTKIHEDQLRPLFTRIANNVIFINTENNL